MADDTATIIESQLDYLTCAVHSSRKAEKLELLAEAWIKTTELADSRLTPWRLMGYEGWRAGRVSFGQRYGAALVQLSGDLARVHFDTLSDLWDSVSRIDMAVTARVSQPNPDLGSVHYRQALDWYQAHPHAAKPSYHGDGDGGYTCYLGDRTSDRFLRIYNKQAEASHDPLMAAQYCGCWRYELESKGQTAGALALTLQGLTADQRAADIQDMLFDYTSRHGITPVFQRVGGAKLQSGFRRRSDRATRLAWLERTVKPSIDWLRQTGGTTDVLSALGLESIIGPNE